MSANRVEKEQKHSLMSADGVLVVLRAGGRGGGGVGGS